MNKRVSFVLVIILGLIVFMAACSKGDEVSSKSVSNEVVQEASLVSVSGEVAQGETSAEVEIAYAKTLSTTAEKVSFLLGQAGAFYDGANNSERFQNTIDIAQYILQYLDADSQEAKDWIAKAKEALVSSASDKTKDVKAGQ
ncbi:hypothetical protein ACFL2J_04205 [Candidatus Omnitrophota bacterium]